MSAFLGRRTPPALSQFHAVNSLLPYTVHFIGHRGKRYGYIPNAEFAQIISQNSLHAIPATIN
jgi:hypothetical protein